MPAMTRTLTERLRVAQLVDVYGRLLTGHQQRLLRLYYLDDLSLGEIAERLAVTRQAVFDGLRRAVAELQRMEMALRVLRGRDAGARRRDAVAARMASLDEAIERLRGQVPVRTFSRVTTALAALRRTVR
jgi:predicted DNA-binding protein YlxM (UPF0122 family)